MKLAAVTFAVVSAISTRAVAQDRTALPGSTTTPDGGAAPPSVDRESASRLTSKALARIKSGAWEEAAELLRRAHEMDPRSAAIATDYGYTLAHLGRRDEAEQFYRLAIKLEPNRFYAYVNLGELWSTDPLRWQRRDETVTFLEDALQALAADPKAHAHVELRLAELLRSLGRPTEARTRLQRLTPATMPAQVRQRATQMVAEIDAETRERALEDWPAPAVTSDDRAKLGRAQAEAEPRSALQAMDALVARWPSWTDARWERARVLERLGQFDEATRDLTIVVQLVPSHAHAWRRLGTILALHGGGLQADRADEALRHALALEPSWADLRGLRNQVAAKRAREGHKPDGKRATVPTAKARQLFSEAQSWMGIEAPEIAPPLLRQALAESPGFVDAAAALYAIEHEVPETTVKALWNDGDGLWQLAVAVGALRSREAAALARPWIDRAVALDVAEARFARASLRAAAGEKAAALEDLRDYVAAAPSPPRLEEARTLRLSLSEAATTDTPERLVHLRLAADRPADALAALGGACRAGLPIDNLLAIGRVHEFTGSAKDALACYQRAVDGAAASPEQLRKGWERYAAAATAIPAVELSRFEAGLQAAVKAKVVLAGFSLARLTEARRQWPEAEEHIRTFLAHADGDEPRVNEARALQARVNKVLEREAQERNLRAERLRAAAILLVLVALAFFLLRRRYRQPLDRALRQQPLLFPALAKAIGQIRHDVLKHRASALELLSDPMTNQQDVARALLEPTPASADVASIYQHLEQEARGLGLRLRPLAQEPVFGPLAADLERAEALLGAPHDHALADLWKLDERLRGEHADRLQALLGAGPRTTLTAPLLARWIDGVANEPGREGWVPPQLHLPQVDVVFPLPEATLASVVTNLLRNAVEAARRQPNPAVALRVEPGRDGIGRRTISLLVADSSPQRLDAETIEKRPADRGLGIVRDTTRSWGGEIVVREDVAPLSKAIGVRFPAPPEGKP